MFNEEVRRMLAEVISSWQVIAVTVVLVIYIAIVKNVARTYRRRPRKKAVLKSKKAHPAAEAPVAAPAKSESEELGLDEDVEEK